MEENKEYEVLKNKKETLEAYEELVKKVAETRAIENQSEEKQEETKKELDETIKKITR